MLFIPFLLRNTAAELLTSCPNSSMEATLKLRENDTYACNCLANFRIATEVILYANDIEWLYGGGEACKGMWKVRLASTFGGTSKDGGAFEKFNPIDCC